MVLERHAHIRVHGRSALARGGLVLGCDNRLSPCAVRKDTEWAVECRNPLSLCRASRCGAGSWLRQPPAYRYGTGRT